MGQRDAELTADSICAACIQANENDNVQRKTEILDAILNLKELPAIGSVELGYCRDSFHWSETAH